VVGWQGSGMAALFPEGLVIGWLCAFTALFAILAQLPSL